MHSKRRLVSLLLALLLCFSTVPIHAFAEPSDWTVLIYMCGTDLETYGGFASHNILEILDMTPSDQVQVVMQTGGTAQWQLEGIDPGKIERFALTGGEFEKVDSQPLASMGAPETLASFLKWGAANYPADKTMLILWNHGGGSIHGIAVDELYEYDRLLTQELVEAFSTLDKPLEVIGFDACLMATLEVAAALAPYSRYMVASEELEPGGGWAYTAFLNYLAKNPQADGEALGKVICDSFLAKCEAMGYSDLTTLSVVDLAEVPALVRAFDAMANEMTGVTGNIDAMRTFSTGVKRSENYGGNTPSEGYCNLVDLGDLVMKTQSVVPDTAIGVLDALFKAVKHQVSGGLRASANGLSVFFPLEATPLEMSMFGEISPSDSYTRFIQVYSQLGNAGSAQSADSTQGTAQGQDGTVYDTLTALLGDYDGGEDYTLLQADDYAVDFVSFIEDDYSYALEITEGLESVESVEFTLYYMDQDDDEYMALGYDNDVISDWDTGLFQDNFLGYWPCLGEEGLLCAPYLIDKAEEYDLFSIPVMLNGEEVSLRAAYSWEEENFRVLGVWPGIDENTGMGGQNLEKLQDGDVIEPLFYAYSFGSGQEQLYTMGKLTVNGALPLAYEDIGDGEYLFQYEVTTVFGEVLYSEPAIIQIENGEVSVRWNEE